MKHSEVLKMVDHTLLAQTATWKEIRQICDDGLRYGTASVCIPPCYVAAAAEYVQGKLPICTVIGFPNGNHTTEAKIYEAQNAIANGASELDMVINIGALKAKNYEYVQNEIEKLKRSNSRNIILEKAKSNRKLQNIKNTFFIYFVTLIQSYNSSLANEVDAILNKLQDNSVTWIDQYNNISIDNCKRKIYENKSQLMGILYQDISQNKKNIQT